MTETVQITTEQFDAMTAEQLITAQTSHIVQVGEDIVHCVISATVDASKFPGLVPPVFSVAEVSGADEAAITRAFELAKSRLLRRIAAVYRGIYTTTAASL